MCRSAGVPVRGRPAAIGPSRGWVGRAGGNPFVMSPGSLGSLVPAAGLGTRPVLVASVRCTWACLGAARAWPRSNRIPHAFLGLRWLSARTRFHRLCKADSSRALFATHLLIVEACRGFGWRAFSSDESGSLLPCRQCHGPFAGSFRLISPIASVPATRRGRGVGGPVRAAFRLLVWRPVRVRADGERGLRVPGRGASLAAGSPAGCVLAAINTRTSKRRYLRLGLIYFLGFRYGSDIF